MAYKKVLLLGTHDSKLAGHVYSAYTAVSQHVDTVLITRLGLYGKEDYCYWPINGSGLSFLEKIRRIRFSRFFFFLWKYVYSDPSELINGYSMNQMIWYVIITEILWMSLGGRKLSKKICNDVRSGNITYNIIKPYNYVEYSLFSHLGITTLKFVLVTILGMILGLIFLKTFPPLNLLSILGIIISCLFATIINILIITTIGLISFFIEDANPLYWLYSKLILVCGTLFPIEYFPIWVRPTLTYSPIYVVSYGPARLFVNYSWSEFIHIFIAQIIYAFIAYSICLLAYRKGVRKLNVNGG